MQITLPINRLSACKMSLWLCCSLKTFELALSLSSEVSPYDLSVTVADVRNSSVSLELSEVEYMSLLPVINPESDELSLCVTGPFAKSIGNFDCISSCAIVFINKGTWSL